MAHEIDVMSAQKVTGFNQLVISRIVMIQNDTPSMVSVIFSLNSSKQVILYFFKMTVVTRPFFLKYVRVILWDMAHVIFQKS